MFRRGSSISFILRQIPDPIILRLPIHATAQRDALQNALPRPGSHSLITHMKNLTLEISLKPFYGLDAVAVRGLCDHVLAQWDSLIRGSEPERISVMFWCGDGSEILDYAGDVDGEIEWGRYLGNANSGVHPVIPSDPEGKSLHARSYLFREGAGLITYRRIAEIGRIWREAITASGRTASIGVTFDPGGEFAPSSFKYERHKEICLADTMGKASFVCCYGILDADQRAYAGFPDGIPQGTSMGTFLGRQFQHYAQDLGFDFLWLSNGFGFGMETWMAVGPMFDGETFRPAKAAEIRDRILDFWKDFRKECPELGLATRGTNLGTGTDLASDATPLRELYEGGFNFQPPPNSPWASLNGDFGIEIAGYLSRIVELPPNQGIPFRFYLHDPWWLNSPWLDRYEGYPHDIYLPMASGRVDASGRVEGAQTLNLLTLDDAYGQMPDVVPNESTPHLLRAWNERPDAAGPVVWLYPFDQLHDAMFCTPQRPERLAHNDWFVRDLINEGFPVNTVVSTRTFSALGEGVRKTLGGRILLSAAPFDAETEQRLLDWVDAGESAMVYGPLDASPRLRERLGLVSASPLSGPMRVVSQFPGLDRYDTGEGEAPDTFEHRAIMSGGALVEAATGTAAVTSVQGGEARALATSFRSPKGGRLWWLRAPLPLYFRKEGPIDQRHLPVPDERTQTYSFGELARQVLADLGWVVRYQAVERKQRLPVLTIHRHDNGWYFSGCMRDTTVALSLRSPFGAPLLKGMETWIKDGFSTYHQPRGWRNECRVFIEQPDGWVKYTEELPGQVGVKGRRWVRGCDHATLRFSPPAEAGEVIFYVRPEWPLITGPTAALREVATPQGRMLENIEPVSGDILISW